MPSTGEQIPPRRKRQRTEAGPSLDDLSESQPSKRLKPSIRLHSAAFYDSLSKVWLTRRALKELDRRTSQANSSQRPASARRRVDGEDTWKKQIQRFARHGGPELRDLRGYPAPTDIDLARTMSSSRSSQSRQTQSTRPTSNSDFSNRRSSAYDGAFEQHLVDHGIYPKGYEYPDDYPIPEPSNLEKIRQRLARPRASLSPSRFTASDFRAFERANDRVISEGKVMRTVFPTIYGNADIPNEGDLVFTQLESITNGITANAKPDFYDGARPEDIDKRVREDLGPYIVPSTHQHAPAAPNFFTEAKPPKGGADVAKRQACYDGALGARGMHQLQSYKQEPVYDNNAYTISSTYHNGQLLMYATHPTAPIGSGNSPEYHTTQLNGWTVTGNRDTYLQGATGFRNGRDLAKEWRDGFISAANERARSMNEVQDATHLTQAEDPEDDSQYYMSQQVFEGGYMNNEPSNFASDYDGLLDTTEGQRVEEAESSAAHEGPGYIYTDSSTLQSSDYNGPSETTDGYPAEESETSPDELALDMYSKPTTSNKRRNRAWEKTVSKAPRHSDGKSGQRRRSKR